MKKWIGYTTGAVWLLAAAGAGASGSPIQVTVSDDQRILFKAPVEQGVLYGSAQLAGDCHELTLDALLAIEEDAGAVAQPDDPTINVYETGTGAPQTELLPSWGVAEIVLGCAQADVMIKQWVENDLIVVSATSVVTEYCP